MQYYETVTEAVGGLTARGYTVNFNLTSSHLSYTEPGDGGHLNADEFDIDEVYRFEGNTDPGDEMVVYAISSASKNVKGIMVNAFGTYSDTISDELMAKLKAPNPSKGA